MFDDLILYQNLIYVSLSLFSKILFKYPNLHIAGYPGHAKMIDLISCNYSWPGLSKDVHQYIHSCNLCQQNKTIHHALYGTLVPLGIPSHNWESISMDFITDLPPSHGLDTLLVFVDCLSKQAHFIPMIKILYSHGLPLLYIYSV